MKLVNKETGQNLKLGDRIRTFDGAVGVLIWFNEPHKPSSSGKVTIRLDGELKDRTYYPSVIGAEFKN